MLASTRWPAECIVPEWMPDAGIGDIPGSMTWYTSWSAFAQAATPTHELGHNLGLGHSNKLDNNNAVVPYGDYSSCMGNNDGVSGPPIPGLCYAFPQQVFLGCECWGGAQALQTHRRPMHAHGGTRALQTLLWTCALSPSRIHGTQGKRLLLCWRPAAFLAPAPPQCHFPTRCPTPLPARRLDYASTWTACRVGG